MTRRRSTLSCARTGLRLGAAASNVVYFVGTTQYASASTARSGARYLGYRTRISAAIPPYNSELSPRADGIHTQWEVPATKPSSTKLVMRQTTLNTMDVPAQVRARPRRAACPDACLVAERRPLRRGLSDRQSVAENRSPRPKLRRLSGRQSVRRGALLARRLPRPRRESIGRGVIAFAQLPWSFPLRA